MGESLEFGGSYPMEVQLLQVHFLGLKVFHELMGEIFYFMGEMTFTWFGKLFYALTKTSGCGG